MSDTHYREIEVSGAPFEMGRQIGEAAREEVRGFVEIALDRVNKTMPVSQKNALSVARSSLSYVESYAPHMLDELRGMAESSGILLEDLMLLQVRNQLRPDGDAGCTSFSITSPAGQRAVVGQNWDNDPGLDPFTVVLTRRPAGKPTLMNITQAGLIAYIGLNSAGIGLCLNTLPAPAAPWGSRTTSRCAPSTKPIPSPTLCRPCAGPLVRSPPTSSWPRPRGLPIWKSP